MLCYLVSTELRHVYVSLKSSQPTPGGSFQQQSSGFSGGSYQQFGGSSLYSQYAGAPGQQQAFGGMQQTAGGQPGKNHKLIGYVSFGLESFPLQSAVL